MANKKKAAIIKAEVKVSIVNNRVGKEKNKLKKRKKLLKVLKRKKDNSAFTIASFLTPANRNVRQSLFTCNVTDITKTFVNNAAIRTIEQDKADKVLNNSKIGGSIFANFLKSVKFFNVDESKVIAICENPEVIFFYGVLKITILSGSVEILGYTLTEKSSPSTVFSLKDSGLLCMSVVKSVRSILNLREIKEKIEEKCPTFKSDMIDIITSNMNPSSVLILLERSKNTVKMKTFLNSNCKSSIFPTQSSINEKLRTLNHEENIMTVEKTLTCLFMHELEPENFFVVSPEWQHLVFETVKASSQHNQDNIVLFAGGKGVGKSTLLRYMINKCLSEVQKKKVVLIDLDPGQCELTLPACLSVTVIDKPLLGPNFSHLNHRGKIWFLGDINVMQCFDKYLKCLQLILNYCSSNPELQGLPWFINSMGFCKGLGVELMSCVIFYLRPTHVIQIQSQREKNNFPALLNPANVLSHDRFIDWSVSRRPGNLEYKLSVIKSVAVANANSTNPPERRSAVILSYFSEMLLQANSSLFDVVPFVFKHFFHSYHYLKRRLGLAPKGKNLEEFCWLRLEDSSNSMLREPCLIPKTEVSNLSILVCHVKNLSRAQSLATVNGNLVALCSVKSFERELDHSCLGFGIVRGLDFENGKLYLLTPCEQELKRVNCLMMGNVFLPSSLYLQSHSSGHVPYVNVGQGQITSKITKRSFRPPAASSFQERFGDESRIKC